MICKDPDETRTLLGIAVNGGTLGISIFFSVSDFPRLSNMLPKSEVRSESPRLDSSCGGLAVLA